MAQALSVERAPLATTTSLLLSCSSVFHPSLCRLFSFFTGFHWVGVVFTGIYRCGGKLSACDHRCASFFAGRGL